MTRVSGATRHQLQSYLIEYAYKLFNSCKLYTAWYRCDVRASATLRHQVLLRAPRTTLAGRGRLRTGAAGRHRELGV
jgi:hypothetical protein